jgi:hypothetical protein
VPNLQRCLFSPSASLETELPEPLKPPLLFLAMVRCVREIEDAYEQRDGGKPSPSPAISNGRLAGFGCPPMGGGATQVAPPDLAVSDQPLIQWNWMFPLLMTRCDVTSDSAPVTVIPN